jgi:proteic killer suppression protein
MIRSFTHRGLEKFYETGSKAGIQPTHAADNVAAMDAPGWNLHSLQGSLTGHWSVKVNGNWRLTFRFIAGDAEVVDYQDYH